MSLESDHYGDEAQSSQPPHVLERLTEGFVEGDAAVVIANGMHEGGGGIFARIAGFVLHRYAEGAHDRMSEGDGHDSPTMRVLSQAGLFALVTPRRLLASAAEDLQRVEEDIEHAVEETL